jgi:hypothetical protein
MPPIALDASTPSDKLGLIQYPKIMTALVEDARLKLGRRTFASGSCTSYGVEDLWTNGLSTVSQLDQLMVYYLELLSVEFFILASLRKRYVNAFLGSPGLLSSHCSYEDIKHAKVSLLEFLDSSGGAEIISLFPISF